MNKSPMKQHQKEERKGQIIPETAEEITDEMFADLEVAEEGKPDKILQSVEQGSKSENLQGYKLPPYIKLYRQGLIDTKCPN